LSWCFFLCCFATLPFVGLSMEIAALVAGAALATFPYSHEFNAKITYIRDFFVTLFFVGLGMQITQPSAELIAKALLVGLVVLAVRWVGIFGVVCVLGGGNRLATVSTINLSQVSEFSLVICTLGRQHAHISETTLSLVIWTFAILAVVSSAVLPHNYAIYGFLSRLGRKLLGKQISSPKGGNANEEIRGHTDRSILLLGFDKTAAMLLAHFHAHGAHLLPRVHVISLNDHLIPQLRDLGVTFAYGDISSPDVLEHAHHGDVRLVISSVPDSILRGATNMNLLRMSKKIWPHADVICAADNPMQARVLYLAGADYVVCMSKLCAERLHSIISEHTSHRGVRSEKDGKEDLSEVFGVYRQKDASIKDLGIKV